MTVALKNISRRPFVAVLYHEHYCANGGKCECKKTAVPTNTRLPSGALAPAMQERLIPKSLRIEGKETEEGLQDAVLQVPQVAQALKARPPLLRQVLTATTPGATTDPKEGSRSSKQSRKPKTRS